MPRRGGNRISGAGLRHAPSHVTPEILRGPRLRPSPRREGEVISYSACRRPQNPLNIVESSRRCVCHPEKIYIIFEAPNYKVRIGNYIDREDAEEVRSFLTNKGFPSAWIVRTKIDVSDELN